MFAFLACLIVYSLLSFGAVTPDRWLALQLLWLMGISTVAIQRSLKNQRLDLALVLLGFASAAVALFVDSKFAVGVTAAGWAYLAARDQTGRTLKFLHILLCIGFLEALLGLVQFFILPGWIFGYEGVNRSSGTLINRNHFAGLLELLIPVTFGLAYLAVRRHRDLSRSYVYILIGAFMGLALVFSLSRTGIFSFFVTVPLLGFLVRSRANSVRWASVLGFGLLGLVVAGALWIGVDVVVMRYEQLLEKDAIIDEGRAIVFRDTIQMIAAHPWGVGPRRYLDFFRQFQTYHPDLVFDHAHNEYLETTAEWGIPVALLFWACIFAIFVRSVRVFLASESPEKRGILLACIGGMFSILLHSLTDFNLQIPSNAMLFFTFVGLSLAVSNHRKAGMPEPIQENAADYAS